MTEGVKTNTFDEFSEGVGKIIGDLCLKSYKKGVDEGLAVVHKIVSLY